MNDRLHIWYVIWHGLGCAIVYTGTLNQCLDWLERQDTNYKNDCTLSD